MSYKIAFLTDLHVSEDRLHENKAAFVSALRVLKEAAPTLIVIGGDLCGYRVPHRPTPAERWMLYTFLSRCAAIAPVRVVRGNHDSIGEFDWINWAAADIEYHETPGLIEAGGLNVVVLPWIDRGSVAAADPAAQTDDEVYTAHVIRTYQGHIDTAVENGRPFLIAAHAAVGGGHVRTGQPAVPSSDPTVPASVLAPNVPEWIGTVCGHYHAPQVVLRRDQRGVFYGGSLSVSEYGEDPYKGVLLIGPDGAEVKRVWVRRRVGFVYDLDARTLTVAGHDLDRTLTLSGDAAEIATALAAVPAPTWRQAPAPGAGERSLGIRARLTVCARGAVDAASVAIVREALGACLANEGAEIAPVAYRVETVRREREGAEAIRSAVTNSDRLTAWIRTNAANFPYADEAVRALAEIEQEIQ